jgi:hypothetical protein
MKAIHLTAYGNPAQSFMMAGCRNQTRRLRTKERES